MMLLLLIILNLYLHAFLNRDVALFSLKKKVFFPLLFPRLCVSHPQTRGHLGHRPTAERLTINPFELEKHVVLGG